MVSLTYSPTVARECLQLVAVVLSHAAACRRAPTCASCRLRFTLSAATKTGEKFVVALVRRERSLPILNGHWIQAAARLHVDLGYVWKCVGRCDSPNGARHSSPVWPSSHSGHKTKKILYRNPSDNRPNTNYIKGLMHLGTLDHTYIV